MAPGIDVVLTGIGKSNAAGAVSQTVEDRHQAILSIGVGGVLPPRAFVAGERVLATRSVFADEGVDTGAQFLTTEDIGFAMPGAGNQHLPPSPELFQILRPLVHYQGIVATVSTCSGTDLRAEQVATRTGAEFENMEGAAVGLVAYRLGRRFAEVRAVSNTTGQRSRQRWEILAALDSLSKFSASLTTSMTV